MCKLTVEMIETAKITADVRDKIVKVFAYSFDVANDAAACLAHYFAHVNNIFLAWENECLVGFQFYQKKQITGRSVFHFSLAGRLPDRRYVGLQAKFGNILIGNAILKVLPWKPVYLAGVTNSAKSYANMHAVGGDCFPDVMQPEKSNPFGALYYTVAEQLSLMPVDEKGLMRDRMCNLGFSLRLEDGNSHPMGQAYDKYVEYRRNDGVFTLIEIYPVRDIPGYLLKKIFFKRIKNAKQRIKNHE